MDKNCLVVVNARMSFTRKIIRKIQMEKAVTNATQIFLLAQCITQI
jgi:hypothetical protein